MANTNMSVARRNSALVMIATTVIFSGVACQSTRQSSVEDPFIESSAAVHRSASTATARANNEFVPMTGADEPVAAKKTVTANAEMDDEPAVVQVTFTPAEARCPMPRFEDAPCPHNGLAGPHVGAADLPALVHGGDHGPYDPHDYKDEYLCDGGDRGYPVHYDAFNRLGLDTEDTIAEFVDVDGHRHVKPTTRTCIYAPRFAAIRTVDAAHSEGLVLGATTSERTTMGAGIRTRLVANAHAQRDAGVGIRVRSRASGVDADTNRDELDQVDRAAGNTKLVNGFENISFLRSGRIEQEDRPVLARKIAAAVTWSRDQMPFVVATLEGAGEVQATAAAAEVIGREVEIEPARLRIVKLADKQSAQRGEIVKFTIRYDNLGGEPLHHLRIVDNLTTRLEYVDDSADSDRAGRLVVEDNGEGSLVLTFEVDEPVNGGEGGVVSFSARVR